MEHGKQTSDSRRRFLRLCAYDRNAEYEDNEMSRAGGNSERRVRTESVKVDRLSKSILSREILSEQFKRQLHTRNDGTTGNWCHVLQQALPNLSKTRPQSSNEALLTQASFSTGIGELDPLFGSNGIPSACAVEMMTHPSSIGTNAECTRVVLSTAAECALDGGRVFLLVCNNDINATYLREELRVRLQRTSPRGAEYDCAMLGALSRVYLKPCFSLWDIIDSLSDLSKNQGCRCDESKQIVMIHALHSVVQPLLGHDAHHANRSAAETCINHIAQLGIIIRKLCRFSSGNMMTAVLVTNSSLTCECGVNCVTVPVEGHQPSHRKASIGATDYHVAIRTGLADVFDYSILMQRKADSGESHAVCAEAVVRPPYLKSVPNTQSFSHF